jgi:outer membrane immunogenic protein
MQQKSDFHLSPFRRYRLGHMQSSIEQVPRPLQMRCQMKKFLLASAAMITLGATSASAADLSARKTMPYKAQPYAQAYNWSGVYLGVNGGGGWGDSNSSDGFRALVGGTIGFNYQVSQAVFGLEGDIDWSDLRRNGSCAAFSCEARNNWLSTVRGRLGYAVDRVMPYVTGGVAFGDIKTSVAGIGDSNVTKSGWTVGGGLEAAIAGPWTAKVEYLHVDLGSGDSPVGSSENFQTNIVRAGINNRF